MRKSGFFCWNSQGLASAKGLINHILQGQVYDVELGWVDYHWSLRWHQDRQYNAEHLKDIFRAHVSRALRVCSTSTRATSTASATNIDGLHNQHEPHQTRKYRHARVHIRFHLESTCLDGFGRPLCGWELLEIESRSAPDSWQTSKDCYREASLWF